MITSPPWILQYNSAGSFEWSSWRPGLETLIQVGALGETRHMQCRSAGRVGGLSGSFLSLLEKETGRGTFPAMSRGKSAMVMVAVDAMGGTVSPAGPGNGGGNKAELAARVAHCIAFHSIAWRPCRSTGRLYLGGGGDGGREICGRRRLARAEPWKEIP